MRTDAERAASAIGGNRLVWAGANVATAVPSVLRQGVAGVNISGAAAGTVTGVLPAGEAGWGTQLTTTL